MVDRTGVPASASDHMYICMYVDCSSTGQNHPLVVTYYIIIIIITNYIRALACSRGGVLRIFLSCSRVNARA